jgi:uncharacterized protein (TIGR04255 family)
MSPLIQAIKLTTPDERQDLLLAVNSFAFVTRDYQTYIEFRSRYLALHKTFCDLADLSTATRFGLRYFNILPPSTSEVAPGVIHPALKLTLGGCAIAASRPVHQDQVSIERQVDDLVLRISLVSPAGAPGVAASLSPGVHLDLDCYTESPGRVDQIDGFLDRAHGIIEDAFFDMITPEYLRYLEDLPTEGSV